MNKTITFILLTLSIIPFAFWKMETEFCDQPYDLTHTTSNMGRIMCNMNSIIIKNETIYSICGVNSIFTYDNKEVNYTVLCLDKCPNKSLESDIDFFMNSNSPVFHKNDSTLSIFYEGPLNIKIRFIYREREQTYNLASIYKDENFLKEKIIRLSTEFKTSSRILVSNQESHVEISQEGKKPKKFQKALQDYFDIDNRNIRLATKFRFNKLISARLLNSLHFKPTAEQIDLLNNSQILSVFGVFKRRGTESIIWGAAKDNRTEKTYPWITDLKTDISFLMEE